MHCNLSYQFSVNYLFHVYLSVHLHPKVKLGNQPSTRWKEKVHLDENVGNLPEICGFLALYNYVSTVASSVISFWFLNMGTGMLLLENG